MLLGVIHNISILLALSLMHYLFGFRPVNNYKGVKEIFMGFAIGIIGIILMMSEWTLQPGLVFDSRTILLSVSGLLIGSIPTIIAMAFTAMYRIYMAGDGIVMGVATILTSGTTGILWGALRPNWYKKRKNWELYSMGMLTHLIMVGCTIFLPEEIRFDTFVNISPVVLAIYPFGTLMLGLIMLTNIERRASIVKYKEAE